MVKCIKSLIELNKENELQDYSFCYEFNSDVTNQVKYELEIDADSVISTDNTEKVITEDVNKTTAESNNPYSKLLLESKNIL